MDAAENLAMSKDPLDTDRKFSYYNAKEMVVPGDEVTQGPSLDTEHSPFNAIEVPPKEIVLQYDQHFKENVNKNHSSVHVPTNVFDRGEWR